MSHFVLLPTHTPLCIPSPDLVGMHAEQLETWNRSCILQTSVEGKQDASTDIIMLSMPFKTGCNLQQLEEGCEQTACHVPSNKGKITDSFGAE